jgi:rubrerythrin
MNRELNAFEVLQIAEEMERNAAKFYLKAAGMFDDPSLNKLYLELAQWEKRHGEVFADMKGCFSEQTWELGRFHLDRVNVARLGAAPAVFGANSNPAQELTGQETRADVLKLAIEKERHTIDYYLALTELALGAENLKVIEDIVQEEKRHVRILTQSLAQATG